MKKYVVSMSLALLLSPSLFAAATHDVDIVGFAFSPSTITIPPGDAVLWTMKDAFTFHTSTSGANPPTADGLWDSGGLTENQTFSHTFTTPGNYPYFCQPHFTFMTASVTVSAASNSPPTVAITSPTNNATISTTNPITISANVTDDGFVAWVEFYDGPNSLGIDVVEPFSVTVTLPPGSHSLTAVATDDIGASTTSAAVTIYVNSVPLNNPIAARIPKGNVTVEVQTVAAGMASPLGMTVPDDGTKRMFVNDQSGLVWRMTSQGLQNVMLDIRSRLVPLAGYDERGLLGVAAHPNFAQNPFVYTYSSEPNNGPADFPSAIAPGTTNNCQSVLAEWRIDPANTNRLDPASRREVLRVDKPQSNHNGGTIRFGPDGFLYISLGDGGQADDEGNGHVPGGNAQNLQQVLGKIIRIDVDARTSPNGQYGVPLDNPFVGTPDALAEIFAYGLRNPYSWSFDRLTGQLYAGDVGQNRVEEVDIIVKGGNYGWHAKEGTFYFDPNGSGAGYVTADPVGPVPPDLIDPIAQYDHDDGLAVVGGSVYRGSQLSALQGRYVFGDWGSFATPTGRLFYLDDNSEIKELRLGLEDRPFGYWLKGFGEDADGELYAFVTKVLGPNGNTGRILKLVPAAQTLSISGATSSVSNLTATWSGGIGPFSLQSKSTLSEAAWVNTSFTAARTGGTALGGASGFFRVLDSGKGAAVPFTAALSGANERPNPVATAGNGSGTFALEGNTLYFEVRYLGLSSNATLAHIHGPGSAGQSAPVLIDLAPFNGGSFGSNGTLSGAVVLTPVQQAMVMAGQTYVNVHTRDNPAGEIRGQIAPVMMQATLNAANEHPINSSTATAQGTFMLVGTQLTFNVTYQGLSGPATASHIHGPTNASANANVIIPLDSFNGGSYGTSGSLEGTVALTPQQLAWLVDGLTYVNFHTVANPGGEIRGQLLPQVTAIPLTATLTGLSERPPITNAASGSATFSLEGDRLTFNVRYKDLSGTAILSHIHGPANSSQSTGVLIDLAPFNGGAFGTNGTLSGSVNLTAAQRSNVLAGLTYVNVHTPSNQGGEIRGQIAPVLMRTYLNGVNERPGLIYPAGEGTGLFSLVLNRLSFNIRYSELTGPAFASHIHGPANLNQSTGVLVDLTPFNGGAYGSFGGSAGTVSLVTSNLASVIDGLTYVNFHTVTNGSGEIRGQISR